MVGTYHKYLASSDLELRSFFYLRAAPYDWRLAIPYLEKRDGYFSNLMATIVDLHKNNANKPVVVMTHSMGCKVAHYFLNWVKCTQPDGQAWLDKHIHAMLPISGPFLGARKSFRAVLTGEDFGLGTFLRDDEVRGVLRRLTHVSRCAC